MPAPTPATVYLNEQGWSKEQVAIAMRVQPLQLHKYLGGHRRVSPGMKTRIVNEFGDPGYILVELCDHAWNVNRSMEKPVAKKRAKREKYTPPVYDGPRYTFDEWHPVHWSTFAHSPRWRRERQCHRQSHRYRGAPYRS